MHFKNLTILFFAGFSLLANGIWKSSRGTDWTEWEEERHRSKKSASLSRLISQNSEENFYEVEFPCIEIMKMMLSGKARISRFHTEEEQVEELAEAIEAERQKILLIMGFNDKGIPDLPYIEKNNPHYRLISQAFGIITGRRQEKKNLLLLNIEAGFSPREERIVISASSSEEKKKPSLPAENSSGSGRADSPLPLIESEPHTANRVIRLLLPIESDFSEEPSLQERSQEESETQTLAGGGAEKPPLDPQKWIEPNHALPFFGGNPTLSPMAEESLIQVGKKNMEALKAEISSVFQYIQASKIYDDIPIIHGVEKEEFRREPFKIRSIALYKEYPQINLSASDAQPKETFPEVEERRPVFNPLVSLMMRINPYASQAGGLAALALSGWLVQNISLMGFTAPTMNASRRRRKTRFLLS